MNFAKSLIGVPGLLLVFTFVCVVAGSYLSYRDGKVRDKIDTGVEKIDTIVTNSERKLNEANKALLKNNDLVTENLEKTITANEKLQKTSEQLQQNYKQIVETLNQTIEGKDATIRAQEGIIGQTTGGDSYPKITLKKKGFYLTVQGKYSIPNLRVTILLISNCLNIPKDVTIDYLRDGKINPTYIKTIFNYTYSKLWAGGHINPINIEDINNYLSTDDGVMHAFEIYYKSDFKIWEQKIRIISYKGKWEIADILNEIPTTHRGNTILKDNNIYNLVSENFPAEQTNSYAGVAKFIPFFNTTPYEPYNLYYEPIRYSPAHGISDFSFDEL
nr:hypothetical protein [uncultured Flavobacterium sp.]